MVNPARSICVICVDTNFIFPEMNGSPVPETRLARHTHYPVSDLEVRKYTGKIAALVFLRYR